MGEVIKLPIGPQIGFGLVWGDTLVRKTGEKYTAYIILDSNHWGYGASGTGTTTMDASRQLNFELYARKVKHDEDIRNSQPREPFRWPWQNKG